MPTASTRSRNETSREHDATAHSYQQVDNCTSAPRLPQTRTTTIRDTYNSLFTIPPALKSLFDNYPRQIYPANALPLRSPSHERHQSQKHTLYIFIDPRNPQWPSPNPTCLKWQTLLKIHDVPFTTRPSNNHAAPGGVLPFLIPAPGLTAQDTATKESASPKAIPASKLQTWLAKHYPLTPSQSASPPRLATPIDSLLPTLLTPFRHAYIYALYLHPPTFRSLATPLYISPASTNTIVRHLLAAPLRAAALEQLILGQPGLGGSGLGVRVDVEGIFEDARDAIDALEVFLGEREWFSEGPGELDAAVFAYMHVILEVFVGEEEGSPGGRLVELVRERGRGLVRHRDRMVGLFFDGAS